MQKEYKIERFNDHPNCKGHANYMLDHEYQDEESRELLSKVLGNYISNEPQI